MDINELITYLLTPAAQIAIIMGLAEVVKRLELIDVKYIPIVDLALGLICGVMVYYGEYSMVVAVLIGLFLGLSACGLFSGVKNLITTYGDPYIGNEEETEEEDYE